MYIITLNNMKETNIPMKDLLLTYKVITKIMKDNKYTTDTSFRRVQSWLSNYICDNMEDGDIIPS